MNAYIPRVGNPVRIMGNANVTGRVMGFGTSNGEPVAIVNLDNPGWMEGHEIFFTNIVVHFSNLERS